MSSRLDVDEAVVEGVGRVIVRIVRRFQDDGSEGVSAEGDLRRARVPSRANVASDRGRGRAELWVS